MYSFNVVYCDPYLFNYYIEFSIYIFIGDKKL